MCNINIFIIYVHFVAMHFNLEETYCSSSTWLGCGLCLVISSVTIASNTNDCSNVLSPKKFIRFGYLLNGFHLNRRRFTYKSTHLYLVSTTCDGVRVEEAIVDVNSSISNRDDGYAKGNEVPFLRPF